MFYYMKHVNSQCICVTAILKPQMHDKRKMAVVPSNGCYAGVWGVGGGTKVLECL